MAGLTIKISADTQGAITQFKDLAASSDSLAAAIEKANTKFASESIRKFIDGQKLAQAALTVTRGETAALDASIASYQRRIESLGKQGFTPETEQVKALIAEMEALKSRKDAAAQASEAQARKEAELAASFEKAARTAEQEAEIAVKSLDAKSALEKENIRLAAEQDNVRESIKKLVASGMSPENAEVKELEGRYKDLTAEIEANNRAKQAQEGIAKGAAAALAAIAAATAAAIGYSVTQAAKVEDMTAAYKTLLGSQEKAAALVKRINVEAATTPFEIESISKSMNKLLPLFKGNSDEAVKTFRMIGDTAGGNAQKLDTLTDAYAKVQMKGKAGMEELNRISDAGVPIFDTLSRMLGVTTAELFEMSEEGGITAGHLTAAFQKMTSEGGTFFNGMVNSSDTFNMRLLGIKENVAIAASQIGEKFLPLLKDVAGAVYNAVSRFSEWVSVGNNLDKMLAGVGYALTGVTTGMAGLLVVMKGKAAVDAMKDAMDKLNKALKGNMIGLIATAVTAVAVPAFIALVKHLDESANKVRILNDELNNQKNIYSQAVTALGGLDENKKIDADTTEKLIRLYPELTGKITAYKNTVGEATAAVEELDRKQREQTIAAMVAAYIQETNAVTRYTEAVEKMSKVNPGGMQTQAMERTLAQMTARAEESERAIAAAYAAIGQQVVLINNGKVITKPLKSLPEEGAAIGEETGGNIAASLKKTLSERLKEIKLTPGQNYSQTLSVFESYLDSMADMEKLSGKKRAQAIAAQEARIIKEMKLGADEREALIAASAAAQKAALQKEAEAATAAAQKQKSLRQKEYDEFAADGNKRVEYAKRRYEAEKAIGEQTYRQKLEDAARYHELETEALSEQLAKLKELYADDDEYRAAETERLNLEILESDRRYENERASLRKKEVDDIMAKQKKALAASQERYAGETLAAKKSYAQRIKDVDSDASRKKGALMEWLSGLRAMYDEQAEMYADDEELLALANKNMAAGEVAVNTQMRNIETEAAALTAAIRKEEADEEEKLRYKSLSAWEKLQYDKTEVAKRGAAEVAAAEKKSAEEVALMKIKVAEEVEEVTGRVAARGAEEGAAEIAEVTKRGAEKVAAVAEEGAAKVAEVTKRVAAQGAADVAKIYTDQAELLMNTFGGAAQSIFNSISQITTGFLDKQQETIEANNEARLAAIHEQYDKLLEEEKYTTEELQALLDSANAKKLAGEQLTAEERAAVEYKMNKEIAASEAELALQQADLDKKRKEEERNAAIFNKIMAGIQIAIDTSVAIMNALSGPGGPIAPWNIAAAAAAAAAGTAQELAVAAIPIPSAETGGRFVVPDTFTGVDRGLMRVNRGETVDVTPRGAASGGGAPQRIVINIDGRTFIDFVNDGLRGGGIYETSPAWNIGRLR